MNKKFDYLDYLNMQDEYTNTPPAVELQMKLCLNCYEPKEATKFYDLKDGTKDCFCTDCILKYINDKDPSTYIGFLKRYDIPYIPNEWDSLVESQIEKVIKNKTEYKSIFGKYLSKMRLKSYKAYTFNDSFNFIGMDGYKKWKNETGEP